MRLFLCDDNPSYRALVGIVLADDYEVVGEAGDGFEAVARARLARPDVLLLDVCMPHLGGLDALPRLRQALPDACIVLLTTMDTASVRDRGREDGADGFLVKPASIFALPAALAEVVGAGARRSPRRAGAGTRGPR
jgi:CheY-like chemotaxis protein